MHDVSAVLKADISKGSIEVAEEYSRQKTLGYGADWCHMATAHNQSIAATCSFYDRLLHLWSPKLPYVAAHCNSEDIEPVDVG